MFAILSPPGGARSHRSGARRTDRGRRRVAVGVHRVDPARCGCRCLRHPGDDAPGPVADYERRRFRSDGFGSSRRLGWQRARHVGRRAHVRSSPARPRRRGGGRGRAGPLSRSTPPGTLRGAPVLPAVIASRGLLTCAFFGLDAFVSYAITNGRSRSTLAASRPSRSGPSVGRSRQDRAALDRPARRSPVCQGRIPLLTPGILVVGSASLPDLVPFWLIYVGAIVAGLGMGFAYSAHSQLALRGVEERHVGSATASLQLCDNLGVGSVPVSSAQSWHSETTWADRPEWPSPSRSMVPAGVAVVGVLLSARLPKTTTASVALPCPPAADAWVCSRQDCGDGRHRPADFYTGIVVDVYGPLRGSTPDPRDLRGLHPVLGRTGPGARLRRR